MTESLYDTQAIQPEAAPATPSWDPNAMPDIDIDLNPSQYGAAEQLHQKQILNALGGHAVFGAGNEGTVGAGNEGTGETFPDKLAGHQETARDQRLEKLFAPFPDKPLGTAAGFTPYAEPRSYVLENGDVDISEAMSHAASETARRQRVQVATEQTKQASAIRLGEASAADPSIARIIQKHQKEGVPEDILSLVDRLRTNVDLRYDLGEYLLGKVARLAPTMPDQVRNNARKRPDHFGYEHVPGFRSQEYTTLLALKMLDGTFDDARNPGDKIVPPSTSDGGGQHRYAAQQLLKATPGND